MGVRNAAGGREERVRKWQVLGNEEQQGGNRIRCVFQKDNSDRSVVGRLMGTGVVEREKGILPPLPLCR